MNIPYSQISGYDDQLQQEIDSKIAKIQTIENEIPAILVIHDIRSFEVLYISQKGLDVLGVSAVELKAMGKGYFEQFFNHDENIEYLPKFMEFLERSDPEEIIIFYQQVKTKNNDEWVWYSSSSKILLRDKNNQPILTISAVAPMDAQHFFSSKVERLFEENKFLRENKHLFASLTKRELRILKLMALGISSEEIAIQLHISKATADTHRRNIRKKIMAETPYEIVRFAQAYNII